jgi:hypothetical protein
LEELEMLSPKIIVEQGDTVGRDIEPVSIYQGTGFQRNNRRVNLDKLSYIIKCNCKLPDGSGCEYIMTALFPEGANTIARTHVRTAHPDHLSDQLWFEQIRDDLLGGGTVG